MYDIIASIIIFLPLIASILVGLKPMRANFAQFITCGAVTISCFCSCIIFHRTIFQKATINLHILEWLSFDNLHTYWSIYIDSLAAIMLLVVTIVSTLVHIYSIGYMAHDQNKQRFMSYLSLFTFFMLLLVTADNLLQLFVGWEGVGLSSFLLIGFWYHKKSASTAAMKAFIVNRVADIGLAIGIILIALNFNTLTYTEIFAQLAGNNLPENYINVFGTDFSIIDCICFCLFIGCMGKSAQIGLHVWLPDAMEGPTPVSALIHAATMVTAGVFLLARCSFLFEYSPYVLTFITVIGAITCIFAASIALVQDDIKKIIAYSTCSQLGYMFFACGLSAYSVAIFHLFTHAFFKALLFLSAGSVIHAIHDEQDIKRMGGLYKVLPSAYVFFWIGSLALAGIFPFAGYFSKDLILEVAWQSNSTSGHFAYLMGLITAFFTAFYSWRLIYFVFHGKPTQKHNNIHPPSLAMQFALVVLAAGAILSGYLGIQISIPEGTTFWHHAIKNTEALPHIHSIIEFLPMLVGLVGIFLVYAAYRSLPQCTGFIKNKFSLLYNMLLNKYYFDELYDRIFVTNMQRSSLFFWRNIDNKFIDGFPNGLAYTGLIFSKLTRFFQTGYINNYAFYMLIGVIFIMYLIIFS
jgi:NADH-quinone oxidoreductase subunit L